MNPHDPNDEIRRLLKQAFPNPEAQSASDLWPRMLPFIEEHAIRVHWLDWALLAATGLALFLLFPDLIPQVAYQL